MISNFIVPGSQESTQEVLEAIHQELAHKETGHTIELRGTHPHTYLRIETSSEDETRALVYAARDLFNDLMSDRATNNTVLLQEPPTSYTGTPKVIFDIHEYGARPKLEPIPLAACKDVGDIGTFATDLSRATYQGLKRAARQQSPLALSVSFGHFVLQSYPRNQLPVDYQSFKAMVDDPRASGHFKAEYAHHV